MWTRRVLLATLVAAAALMSLPRHVPASWNTGFVQASLGTGTLR